MDSLLGSNTASLSANNPLLAYQSNPAYSGDLLVVEKTLGSEDSVSLNFQDQQKGLIITAQEIVKKLNELLKGKIPNGIESLNPEDHTSEATSTRIVQGATAFFSVFAEQNPDLSDEELLDKFMETIKSGIQKGYDEAFATLEGLGAFQLDGIQAGIEKTKILIDSKLEAFYQSKREELGLEPKKEVTEEKAAA